MKHRRGSRRPQLPLAVGAVTRRALLGKGLRPLLEGREDGRARGWRAEGTHVGEGPDGQEHLVRVGLGPNGRPALDDPVEDVVVYPGRLRPDQATQARPPSALVVLGPPARVEAGEYPRCLHTAVRYGAVGDGFPK